jgi:hypothetical protein
MSQPHVVLPFDLKPPSFKEYIHSNEEEWKAGVIADLKADYIRHARTLDITPADPDNVVVSPAEHNIDLGITWNVYERVPAITCPKCRNPFTATYVSPLPCTKVLRNNTCCPAAPPPGRGKAPPSPGCLTTVVPTHLLLAQACDNKEVATWVLRDHSIANIFPKILRHLRDDKALRVCILEHLLLGRAVYSTATKEAHVRPLGEFFLRPEHEALHDSLKRLYAAAFALPDLVHDEFLKALGLDTLDKQNEANVSALHKAVVALLQSMGGYTTVDSSRLLGRVKDPIEHGPKGVVVNHKHTGGSTSTFLLTFTAEKGRTVLVPLAHPAIKDVYMVREGADDVAPLLTPYPYLLIFLNE